MSIYRLPRGQYGYSGHVINLPQDIPSFVQSLPCVPSDLDTVIVRKDDYNTHHDFHVRRSRIQSQTAYISVILQLIIVIFQHFQKMTISQTYQQYQVVIQILNHLMYLHCLQN